MDKLPISSNIKHLAGEFGSWDVVGLQDEIRRCKIPRAQGIGFFLTLLIYDHLMDVTDYDRWLGSSQDYDDLAQVLYSLAWDKAMVELVGYGRKFKELARAYLYSAEQAIPDYWDYINPNSTAGRMGWMRSIDVSMLVDRLNQDRLRTMCEETGTSDYYNKTMKMLQAAKTQETGLCLIVSG